MRRSWRTQLGAVLAAAASTARAQSSVCTASTTISVPPVTRILQAASTCTLPSNAPTITAPYTTIYQTVYLEFCPTGLQPKTYTVTETCPGGVPTPRPDDHIPPGFTTTVSECNVCGKVPITATLTVPCGDCKGQPGGPGHGPTASPGRPADDHNDSGKGQSAPKDGDCKDGKCGDDGGMGGGNGGKAQPGPKGSDCADGKCDDNSGMMGGGSGGKPVSPTGKAQPGPQGGDCPDGKCDDNSGMMGGGSGGKPASPTGKAQPGPKEGDCADGECDHDGGTDGANGGKQAAPTGKGQPSDDCADGGCDDDEESGMGGGDGSKPSPPAGQGNADKPPADNPSKGAAGDAIRPSQLATQSPSPSAKCSGDDCGKGSSTTDGPTRYTGAATARQPLDCLTLLALVLAPALQRALFL